MAQQSTAPTGPGQLPPETFGTHFEGALQYGVAQRRARKNEDRYCVVVAPTSTRKDGTQSPPWCDLLLAVFDGHNGWRAAEECVRALPKRISQRLAILEEEPGGKDVTDGPGWSTQLDKAILQGFNDVDADVRAKFPDGTTATIVLLKLSTDGRCGVKCAWVGDSRACIGILDPTAKAERVLGLSRDHKASDPTEATRMDTFYQLTDNRSREGTARGTNHSKQNTSLAGGTNPTKHSEVQTGDSFAGIHARGDVLELSSVKAASSVDPGSRHASFNNGTNLNGSNTSGHAAADREGGAPFDPRDLGLTASMGQDGYWVIDAPQAPIPLRPGMRRNGSSNPQTPTKRAAAPSEASVAGGSQNGTGSAVGTPGVSLHGPGLSMHGPSMGPGLGPESTTAAPKSAIDATTSNVQLNLNALYEKSCHGPTNVIDLKVYLKAEAIQHARRDSQDSRRQSRHSRTSQAGAKNPALSNRVRAEVDDLLSKLGLTETEAAVLRAQRMASQEDSRSLHVEDSHKPPESAVPDEGGSSGGGYHPRRRVSFVGRLRDPNTGALSNLRLFGGKLGASTAMTRSIGDREAARCCISEPEVVTMVVEATQKARIVICSDGVWDVYDNAEAVSVTKGNRLNVMKTSLASANHLAAHALEDRVYDGLPADDITVIIADVFGGMVPRQGGEAGSSEGGCCALQ